MSSKHQHQISTELKITAWISHLATFEAQSCQVLLVLVAPHRVWHRVYLTSHLPLSGHQCHHHLHCSYSSFQTLPFSPLHIQIYHNSQSTLFGFFLNFETTLCSCSWSSEAFTGFSNSFDPGLQKGAEGCKQRFTVQWKVWQIVNLHLGLLTYLLRGVYSHTLACINPVKRT